VDGLFFWKASKACLRKLAKNKNQNHAEGGTELFRLVSTRPGSCNNPSSAAIEDHGQIYFPLMYVYTV